MGHSKKISVDTPLGKLCAVVGGDPDYPEMFTYLERPDGTEFDLSCAGYDKDKNAINLYSWENPISDDFTRKVSFSKKDIFGE